VSFVCIGHSTCFFILSFKEFLVHNDPARHAVVHGPGSSRSVKVHTVYLKKLLILREKNHCSGLSFNVAKPLLCLFWCPNFIYICFSGEVPGGG
jgi:hypothetical protein